MSVELPDPLLSCFTDRPSQYTDRTPSRNTSLLRPTRRLLPDDMGPASSARRRSLAGTGPPGVLP